MRSVVTGADGIRAPLVAAWRALADGAAEPNSFAEPWFVLAGLNNLAAGEGVRLLQIWDEGGPAPLLVGILPLCVAPKYGRAPIRHVENWRHANDFLGAPLIRAGQAQRFWVETLAVLDRADWAAGFLHIDGLVEGGEVHEGLAAAAAALARPCPVVHRSERALLASQLSPDAYYADTVRKKKRKELGRLARRLADLGEVTSQTLVDKAQLTIWCEAFLALEQSGWKGRAGSALACSRETEAFFRDALAGALAADRLEFRRMDLDDKPIAMLINFVAPPGSFSFKTAFDEDYARFSPGVLIQLDNLSVMTRSDIAWMDSCAAQNHPMIDSLWGERRSIVRVSVPLSGMRSRLAFEAARALEEGSARLRRALRERGNG